MSGDKGNFSTEIGDDVIAAALRSVEKKPANEARPEPAAEPAEAGAEQATESASEQAEPEVAAPPPSPEQAEIESLKAQVEFSTAKGRELAERIKETHEKMLRAVADLDNYKRRAAKEKEDLQKFGNEKLLKDFLPVADNLDRALTHSEGSADVDALRQGVEMTAKLLSDTLARHGVKGFSALGEPFDPRFHEAISRQETAEAKENTVVTELVKGYLLNERLVRPALVVVAQAPSVKAPTEGTEATEAPGTTEPKP